MPTKYGVCQFCGEHSWLTIRVGTLDGKPAIAWACARCQLDLDSLGRLWRERDPEDGDRGETGNHGHGDHGQSESQERRPRE